MNLQVRLVDTQGFGVPNNYRSCCAAKCDLARGNTYFEDKELFHLAREEDSRFSSITLNTTS